MLPSRDTQQSCQIPAVGTRGCFLLPHPPSPPVLLQFLHMPQGGGVSIQGDKPLRDCQTYQSTLQCVINIQRPLPTFGGSELTA